MQSIKQFQSDDKRIFASVVSEPRQGLLMDIWNSQVPTVENLAMVMEYSLQSIQDNKLSGWLSDASKLEALFEFNGEAAASYLSKRLKGSSLRKFAFIHRHTQTRINTPNMDRLIRIFLESGVDVKVCSSSVAAMQWLLMPSVIKKSRPMLEV